MSVRRSKRLARALEDNFSPLPRDCILEVFSFLDRDTLDELKCVSKHVQSIVEDPSVARIKKDGHLVIFENRFGHSFYMIDENEYLWFNIGRAKRPTKGLRSRVNGGANLLNCTLRSLRCRNINAPGASAVIPSMLFENVHLVSKKYRSKEVSLSWIRVDDHLINQLRMITRDTPIDELMLYEVMFDDSLDMNKLSELFLSANIKRLTVSLDRQAKPLNFAKFLSVFDEQFLTEFARHAPKSFELSVFSDDSLTIPFQWVPSKEFIPILCGFNSFIMDNMKLDPTALLEFIMKVWESEEEKRSYQFALTGEVLDAHLDNMDLTMFSMSYWIEREALVYELRKNGSDYRIVVRTWQKRSGDLMVAIVYEVNPSPVVT